MAKNKSVKVKAEYTVETMDGPYGLAIPTRGLFKGDELVTQVESYMDLDPESPQAWGIFRQRLSRLHTEFDLWKTIIIDSLTFAEIAARLESKYNLNKTAKDERRHYAYSTDEIERACLIRFGSIPCNVVVLCHIDETIVQDEEHKGGQIVAARDEVNGAMVRNPAAPGRLRKRLPGGYDGLFHAYTEFNGPERTYVWQTQPDAKWNSMNSIDAPSPCLATYDSLWENWEGEHPALHIVCYGDPGSGKSTGFATFPKPLLVFNFDPQSKSLPYLRPKETWTNE